MQLQRPHLRPDASLDRQEMETLQRSIASAAEFTVTRSIDPADDSLTVAGIDQAFLDDSAISAVVVMEDNSVLETTVEATPLEIPYIPGLLAFREGGPIISALEALETDPDILLLDGNGRIHPRQAGLATHIGVLFDCPTIGVAKRLLCGTLVDPPPEPFPVGTRVPIEADESVEAPPETVLGYAVQTRQFESSNRSINPVYVSPGHRIDADTAAAVVCRTTAGYKLPEPIRLADRRAAQAKAAGLESESE